MEKSSDFSLPDSCINKASLSRLRDLIFDDSCLNYPFWVTAAWTFVYAFMFVTGMIGNLVVGIVLLCKARMRRITGSIFILGLGIADTIVLLISLPTNLATTIIKPWILGEKRCRDITYSQGVSMFCSVFCILAITFDRYMAVRNTRVGKRLGLSKHTAFILLALILFTGLLLYLPWTFVFEVIQDPSDNLLYCQDTWESEATGKIYFVIVNLILSYILPLVSIIFLNHLTFKQLRHPSNSEPDYPVTEDVQRESLKKAFRTIWALTITFAVTRLPLYLLSVMVIFSDYPNHGHDPNTYFYIQLAIHLSQLANCFNSSANPFLYYKLDETFQCAVRTHVGYVRQQRLRWIRGGDNTAAMEFAPRRDRMRGRLGRRNSRSLPSDLNLEVSTTAACPLRREGAFREIQHHRQPDINFRSGNSVPEQETAL